MYYSGEKGKIPFEIKCTNCGSHNVDIDSFEDGELCIECNNCGMYLNDTGSYNEANYI